MTLSVQDNLVKLGLTLPAVSTPGGSYLTTRRLGALLFISGQIPKVDGKPSFIGKVGDTMDPETATDAARNCTLNMLAQLGAAVDGDFDRVVACGQLRGFVNAVPDFAGHVAIINGASELLVAALGPRGQHARTAIGVGSLPHNVAVELDAIFEIRD